MAENAKRGQGLTIVHAPIERAPDPWTPVTMLEEFLASVKSGEVKTDKGMMIFYLEPGDEGRLVPHYWSTGLSQTEIIAFSEVVKSMAIHAWKD